jgi:hypothetical protein
VVDAKEGSRAFYLENEFTPFATQPSRLFLLMKKIDLCLKRRGAHRRVALLFVGD